MPKKIFFLNFIVLFCMSNRIFAIQYVQLQLQDVINSSDAIIEGTVIADSCFLGSDGIIYTSNIVQISKILKANIIINCGKVEIITFGGRIASTDDDQQYMESIIPGDLQFDIGQTGIFMLKQTGLPSIPAPLENPVPYVVYAGVQGFVLYENIGATTLHHWYWYDLPNLDSLYSYFNALTGYTYTTCSYDKRALHKTDTTVTDAINYSFANEKLSGTTPDTLQFDIQVACGLTGTFLDQGHIGISYNTSAFGINVSTNGKIFTTMKGSFNNGAYGIGNIDHAPNLVDIYYNYSGVSSDKTIELGSPKVFCHVVMIISTPCINTSDLAIHYIGSNYYTGSNSNPPVGARSSYLNGSIDYYDQNLCTTTYISSFSPTTIDGGLEHILTIHGLNFGSTQGNKKVYFTNAQYQSGPLNAVADTYHIQTWHDSEITLFVPGSCPADTGSKGVAVAGTGPIAVGTTASKVMSSSNLTIKYSLLNERHPDRAHTHPTPYQFYYLRDINGSGGYTFKLNSSDFGPGSGTSWEKLQCFK